MRKTVLGCAGLLVVAMALGASPAFAQRVDQLPGGLAAAGSSSALAEARIAAVVNDAIISWDDVKARMKLALMTSGLPNTPEVRAKLLPQVLQGLVNEHLQIQEGRRLEIAVSGDDIRKALDRLAEDNKVPGGDIVAFLEAQGVPSSTMLQQVRAGLTWSKVAQRELRPRVDIGDDEVDAVAERLRARAGQQEYLVSEIYLAVDAPQEEERVRAFAESLVQQIKGGGNFGAIARQFSQGTGAAAGGDIGWVQAEQLAPELGRALPALQAGEIAGPVRSVSGFHILGVREKRTVAGGDPRNVKLQIQQAFRPFGPDADRDALLREADRLRQSVQSCEGLPARLAQDFGGWRWQDLGEVKLGDAPPWLADKVRDIAVGRTSDAMATDRGALILFVCGRKVPDGVDRDAILNALGTERMERLARRLLRDLRAKAYLDIRTTGAS